MHYIAKEKITVLQALMSISQESSKATLRTWIKHQRVFVNEKCVRRENETVEVGEEVVVHKKRRFLNGGIQILFEDQHLIVIEKPAGLLSVETPYQKEQTAHAILKRHRYPGRVLPVHRLDRETSGVLVFACSLAAKEGLKRQFEKHQIERVYHALVEGIIEQKEGRWESELTQDAAYFVRSSEKGGKRAVTHFRVLKRQKNSTLLEIQLETGRKNQIRVHCSESGYPIVGDKKYGSQSNPFGRLCLHAARLGFVHPILNKPLLFTSPLQEVFSPPHSWQRAQRMCYH